MKSLVILAAFLVLAKADGDVDFKTCKAEVEGFKQCVKQQVDQNKQEAFAKLKADLTQACFQNTVCKFPDFPPQGEHPHGSTHTPHTPPTPPPSVAQCLGGAKDAFVGCIKKQLSLPDNANFGGDFQGPPKRPPFFHGHPNASAAQAEIHKIALAACNNDEVATKNLEDCGKKFFIDHFKNQKPPPPIAAACKAAASCIVTNKFSSGCVELFKKGRKAFCDCKNEFPKFVESSDSCAELRSHKPANNGGAHEFAHDAGHNATHEHLVGASANVHDFPHDHAVPFDFCDSNGASPFEICKKLLSDHEHGHFTTTAKP